MAACVAIGFCTPIPTLLLPPRPAPPKRLRPRDFLWASRFLPRSSNISRRSRPNASPSLFSPHFKEPYIPGSCRKKAALSARHSITSVSSRTALHASSFTKLSSRPWRAINPCANGRLKNTNIFRAISSLRRSPGWCAVGSCADCLRSPLLRAKESESLRAASRKWTPKNVCDNVPIRTNSLPSARKLFSLFQVFPL